MIKTLTPYYINVPLINPITLVICESYTVRIFIWNGNKTATPAEPEYEITKINAAGGSGTDKINIGRIVNDFIDFQCDPSTVTELVNGNNQVWVKFECLYNDTPSTAQLVTVQLATKGYGYFLEGENPQLPASGILLTGDEFKVNRDGLFVLPIYVGEPVAPAPEFIITDVDSVEDLIEFTANFTIDNITVRYRNVGSVLWSSEDTLFITSPIEFEIPITGEVEVQLNAYDALTNQMVYSNIYTVTI